jgi:transmembrane sensor
MTTEKEFEELLDRYLKGNVTVAEERSVEKWYASLEMGNPHERLTPNEEKRLMETYWSGITNMINQKKSKVISLWPAIGVAASIALVVVSFLFYQYKNSIRGSDIQQTATAEKIFLEFVNNEALVKNFVLPDSSLVSLHPQSKVQLEVGFNEKERKVVLVGEAFFNVSHNPQKPFYVITDQVVTRVLGTSFIVRAIPGDKNISVSVKTGKVSVFAIERNQNTSKPGRNMVLLTPNQQAVFSRGQQVISKKLVEDPVVIMPPAELTSMRFVHRPVTEIFEALEKMYGIELNYDQKTFEACTITTSITKGSLYNKLEIICDAIGATYSVEETKINIKGNGCR